MTTPSARTSPMTVTRTERVDYLQVVMAVRLLSAMRKINPHIPPVVLKEAALSITKPKSPVLIHNNRAFHRMLLEGVPVEYSDGDETRHNHAQLIDFNNFRNNRFLVVSQFTIQGTRMNHRPDVVAFVNGLPIAVIELENPSNSRLTSGTPSTSCRPTRRKFPTSSSLTKPWW